MLNLDPSTINNFENYLPIFLFLGLGFFIAAALMCLTIIRSKRNPYANKVTPYECGFDAFDKPEVNARSRISIQFYLISILFIIFDLETAFLFPWAVTLREIGNFGFWSMVVFLSVLTVGLFYEYKKGALDWD